MSPADYKTERQQRGTLKGVAGLLGIHWTTLARRESGVIELTTEMALAMRSLPLRKPKRSRKGTNIATVHRENSPVNIHFIYFQGTKKGDTPKTCRPSNVFPP